MYTTYFIIPKAVYFYCIVPAIAIIIASIIFGLIYHKKKGTHYYIYTMNYVYNFASILLCLLLFPLLLGYVLAMAYIINRGLIENVSFIVNFILILLPLIPFVTLAFVSYRFVRNLHYKEQLDEERDNLSIDENNLNFE